jgi:hypothetical protein
VTELTREERLAVAALRRLAKRWPQTLWLFSASGSLHVMRRGPDGHAVHYERGGGVDRDYIVETITGISNDGGDW